MATKGEKKVNIEANEIFLQYQEEIVNNPVYKGMPDLRHENGSIQWEAPSNRASGVFKDSHDKRLNWWKNKAHEVGISTDENQWISKVAKKIHPTGFRPCKVCGNVMDIRYCYLSSNFMKRVAVLPFFDFTISMSETTHILDFLSSFMDTYGNKAYDVLPALLSCKQCPNIPFLPKTLDAWNDWINNEYIPLEPSMLGPGSMSNAPDRLDGFHSFNRCCRSKADKGRSKENLQSYSTDRRAFENWVDGNWITANKLMGYINSNSEIKKELCANYGDGQYHPRPCSADHIGPISLGFCHRPEFQLLCAPCNSGKNNRMYFSDVQHLIKIENTGETVSSWYANPIWQLCKYKVTDKESALRLSRIMRDNRNVAMMLLNEFLTQKEYLFLFSLLNLNYANYEYSTMPGSLQIINHIVTIDFRQNPSSLKYVNTQKIRKIRVAFLALEEYAAKENRNGYVYSNTSIKLLKNECFSLLKKVDSQYINLNNELINIFMSDDIQDSVLEAFLNNIDYEQISSYPIFCAVKASLIKIMENAAQELFENWDNPRYSRE